MIALPQELKEMFADTSAVKILGTVDDKGIPHVVIKDSTKLLDDGTIAYAEGLDSSITSKNLVRSIWFDKTVSITIVRGERCYQIKGKPYKCLITGPFFKEFLLQERAGIGADADIQAVWIITPTEARNESRKVRKQEELKKDPLYNIHLDKLKVR
jgi:hypothetical protein